MRTNMFAIFVLFSFLFFFKTHSAPVKQRKLKANRCRTNYTRRATHLTCADCCKESASNLI